MAGLVAAKEYSWKDSNVALIGSTEDREARKKAAQTEPAWKIVLETTSPRLIIWRIENLKVVEVLPTSYGQFYDGDTYIVLNIYTENEKLMYDVHFWIGSESSQDEYGCAAYKVVELDSLLDDKAIQHREVHGFESDLFLSYFDKICILSGGVKSAFNHVEPESYQPRLLHFCLRGKNQVSVEEVTRSRKTLTSNDVFILDLGTKAFQWNGKSCNKEEKYKAAQFLQQLEAERNGRCVTEVLEEATLRNEHEFYKRLTEEAVREKPKVKSNDKALYKLSDESGKLKFTVISKGTVPRSLLTASDVYFIDSRKQLFVYIGNGCSFVERSNAIAYAHEYLKTAPNPLAPISVVAAGQSCKELENVFD